MQCDSYFQPFIAYLQQPTQPISVHVLNFLIAGNRTETNRFVTYMEGTLFLKSSSQLTGTCAAYFSDRSRTWPSTDLQQPFDANRIDDLDVSLAVPNGPLTFSSGGRVVSTFTNFECNDNGLLVCTSQLDRSIFVLSFSQGVITRQG